MGYFSFFGHKIVKFQYFSLKFGMMIDIMLQLLISHRMEKDCTLPQTNQEVLEVLTFIIASGQAITGVNLLILAM